MRSLDPYRAKATIRRLALLLLFVLGLIFVPRHFIKAADVSVSDAVSLINAIHAANRTSEAYTITLTDNIVLSRIDNTPDDASGANGLPLITSEITIEGGGFTIERDSSLLCDGSDPRSEFRIFDVAATGSLTLKNVTVRNGCSDHGGGAIRNNSGTLALVESTLSDNTAAFGGGIGNGIGATLTITGSTLSDNTATGFGYGGAIHNLGKIEIDSSRLTNNSASVNAGGILNNALGTVSITNSVLSNNSAAEFGGAISNGGMMTISNSTLMDNMAASYGGGGINNFRGAVEITNSTLSNNSAAGMQKYGGGGIYNDLGGMVTVTNSTLANNATEAGSGGGIYSFRGRVRITNSIVANSTNGDCAGGTYLAANNLASEPCGATAVTKLDPILAYNGGPVPTHALLPGSNAIDKADDCSAPDSDQRGEQRPQGAACDIGAYESPFIANEAPVAQAGGTYNVDEGSSLTLNGSGSDLEGEALTFAWDLDNNGDFETAGANPTFSTAALDGPQTRTVVLRVCDAGDSCQTDSATIHIHNVPPTITSFVVLPGNSYDLTAAFTDPGPEAHSANINWGDGTNSAGSVDQDADMVSAAHNYPRAGQYLVEVCVSDDDGGADCRRATVTIASDSDASDAQSCAPPGQGEPPRGVPECVPSENGPRGQDGSQDEEGPGGRPDTPPGRPDNPPGRPDTPPGRSDDPPESGDDE